MDGNNNNKFKYEPSISNIPLNSDYVGNNSYSVPFNNSKFFNNNSMNNMNRTEGNYFNNNSYMTNSSSRSTTNKVSAEEYYKESIIDHGKEGRKASNIYFLRTFNNFIKATLIQSTVKKLNIKHFSVLDLCCGKGGDLDKFFQNNSKVYVGADMAPTFLKNAKDRIEKIKQEKKKDIVCKCILIEENLSDPDNNLMNKIPNFLTFDIVSCQMAMHYHFGSEENLRAFLKNVVSKLNPGGYFISTIIDDNILVKRLRTKLPGSDTIPAETDLKFGNEFYSVKFESNIFSKKNPFGIKYGFYLEDSIDKRGINGEINYVEEYLIIFDKFIEICEEMDLYLEEKQNFHDYYKEKVKEEYYNRMFKRFAKGMDIENYQKQWEIIHLYQLIVLRKGKRKPDKYTSVVDKFEDKLRTLKDIDLKLLEFD